MIDIFREEFQKLTSDEQKHEQMINSLRMPCQIHILSSPSKKFHQLLKTHFPQLKDKVIKIIQLSNDTFIDQLEDFQKDPMWLNIDQETPDGEMFPGNPSQYVQQILVNLGKMIRNKADLVTSSYYNGIGGMMLQNNEIAVWDLYGDLNDIGFKENGKRITQEYKSAFAQMQKEKMFQKPVQITESVPNTKSGFGTYCYPPLLIGDFDPSLRDQITNREREILNENVIESKFSDIQILINKDGIISLETKERTVAEKILNTIMGVALILGLPLYGVKPSEIANVTIDKSTNRISASSWKESTLRMKMFGFTHRFSPIRELSHRMHISIKDMELVLKKASTLWQSQEHANMLKLLLGSFTHLDNHEFSQSFIMSWMIIERYLYDLWNSKIKGAGVTNRITEDLNRWDVYRVLEILHIDKVIPEDDYVDARQLHSLRNDLIHFGYEVTEKQSEECYDMAFQIITDKIGIDDQIKYKDVFGNY